MAPRLLPHRVRQELAFLFDGSIPEICDENTPATDWMKKVLLVSSEDCEEIEHRLQSLRYQFVQVSDGQSAVERVETEMFDAAVVVSTGAEMDPLETAFNLNDIAASMPIFMIRPRSVTDIPQENLFPYIKWCCVAELDSLL